MPDRKQQPASPPPGAPLPHGDSETSPGFRRLQTGPQTAIDLAALAPDERAQVHVLAVDTPARPRARTGRTSYIPVYYLHRDEADAITLFADLNAHRLADVEIDAVPPTPLEDALPTALYIRVLAAAGRISVRRYQSVVRETRPAGTIWLIEPAWYDDRPDARYEPGPHAACVPPTVDLQAVYYECDEVISRAAIHSTPIEGTPGAVLRYYWAVDEYHCHPEQTADSDLVLRKHSPDAPPASDAHP